MSDKVPCKCGNTMVPNWEGYTSGRVKCSTLCDNTYPIYCADVSTICECDESRAQELQIEYEIAMEYIESLGIKGWTSDLEAFAIKMKEGDES